jgi:large subunit ribosomal protein L22
MRTVAPSVRRVVSVSAVVEAPVAAPAPAPVTEKVARAGLRFQRGSVFKVRRVLDTIRGKSYEEALMLMEYMPYRACEPILKCLLSAAANAKHNLQASKTKLYVSEIYADMGPVMKRFRPRSKGRPFPRDKQTYHLTIKVTESMEAVAV